jgi:prepilin-type N-terminal cleavage/methylation domain-containing protein
MKPKAHTSTKAYTLIEILVVLTIVAILFTVGYVGYRDFGRRQALAGIAKQIEGDLRLAQQMALSGEKPQSQACLNNALDGISFGISSAPYYYRIRAVCGNGGYTTYPLIKEVAFPTDITPTINIATAIIFKVLGQGTNIPGSNAVITLTQAGTNKTISITVEPGGSIR